MKLTWVNHGSILSITFCSRRTKFDAIHYFINCIFDDDLNDDSCHCLYFSGVLVARQATYQGI